uniref:Uncharacterized protein n=1 Tax=Oryza sativa subsp. japonica TaxID=39947 RepID=Q6ERL0_ORYSJ|nr:hypothetical protein [Oryza sativa Japonica Group]BAD28710.1 hypothetical protein [Oryza sativa Japonica Group]
MAKTSRARLDPRPVLREVAPHRGFPRRAPLSADRCPLGAPTPAAGIAASGEVVGTSSSSVGLPHPPTPHGIAVRLVLLLRCVQRFNKGLSATAHREQDDKTFASWSYRFSTSERYSDFRME